MFLFFVLYHFMLSGNFCYGSEIQHGIFGGKFWPRDFLGLRFLPLFDHPCHLKSGVSPLGLSEAEKLYKDAEFFTLSIPS